jgi:hypothetical protein
VQRLLDDLEASTSLNADVVVDVSVRPDRGRGGDEDLLADPESLLKPMTGSSGEPELTRRRTERSLRKDPGLHRTAAWRDQQQQC